jgi:hypothetical protein
VDIRGQPLGQFEGAAHGRVFAVDCVMAKQTSQAGMHLGQRVCAGLLGLWALLHGGGLMAQGLYIAQVPTVCMTPVAGSKQAVPLPYVVAQKVPSGSKVPSQAQACQQMGLKAMKSPVHRGNTSQMKKH